MVNDGKFLTVAATPTAEQVALFTSLFPDEVTVSVALCASLYAEYKAKHVLLDEDYNTKLDSLRARLFGMLAETL